MAKDPVPLVTLGSGSNSTKWKIQGEWSNAAYNAGTGLCEQLRTKGVFGRTLSRS